MRVYELIEQLKQLPQDDDIIITAMNDEFVCGDFQIYSPYDDGQAQEIILPMYIKDYIVEGE